MQRRIVAVVAALGLLVTACSAAGSSGGTQSITDADQLTRIDLPADWEYYSNESLAGIADTPFVIQAPGAEMPVVSRFAFDAAPIADPNNLLGPISQADFPVGSSVVRRISPDVRDFVSRYLLAEVVVPYHSASASEELFKQDIDLGDDHTGVQLAVVYKDLQTDEDVGVMFISATDPEVTTLFQVAIGCSLECFQIYGPTIREIVDTWLVNTRG
jgi:hypothetical protein